MRQAQSVSSLITSPTISTGRDGADVAAFVTDALELGADRGEVPLEVLDEVHRRERLPGDGGGADLGAATAADAGVELEELLPGEVLDLADAEDLLLLDVLDGGEAAGGVGAQEEGVDGREDHVVEAREDEQAEPAEGEPDVAPPRPGVGAEHVRLRDVEEPPELGEAPRDERPARPAGLRLELGPVLEHEAVELGAVDTERLDEEAGDEDQAEAGDDGVVLDALVPADAMEVVEVAAVEGHADADEADQAEEVAVEGEEQVVAPVEEVERGVVVDRDLGGDEGEHDNRGEDAEVHDPRVAVAVDLFLANAEQQGVAGARGDLAQDAGRGLADRPQSSVAAEAVDEQARERGEQDIDRPGLGDVEEDLAAGVSAPELEGGDEAEAAQADGRAPPRADHPHARRLAGGGRAAGVGGLAL